MDYSKTPVIVLGVNHSGTRVIVDILSALGSEGGHCQNVWRENELFLDAHYCLVGATDTHEWNRKIFDLDYLLGLRPTPAMQQQVRNIVERGVATEYPEHLTKPWHWKCPTSAFFLEFWQDLYPDAYYVHVTRDRFDVASSLIVRRQFYGVRSALRFCDTAESLLAAVKARNYLHLNYSDLDSSLSHLIEFVPGLRRDRLDQAIGLIHETSVRWSVDRSLKKNLWAMVTGGRISMARRMRGHSG